MSSVNEKGSNLLACYVAQTCLNEEQRLEGADDLTLQ
jgi:hypothetical protein